MHIAKQLSVTSQNYAQKPACKPQAAAETLLETAQIPIFFCCIRRS